MHTITFFDGTFRHVRDEQARALGEDLVAGRKHIMIDGTLFALSSVSRIDPSHTWLADQREKYLLAECRICDFGHRHARGEKCNCLSHLRIPLLPETARQLLDDLGRGQRVNALTDEGRSLLSREYPRILAEAFPELPPLIA